MFGQLLVDHRELRIDDVIDWQVLANQFLDERVSLVQHRVSQQMAVLGIESHVE